MDNSILLLGALLAIAIAVASYFVGRRAVHGAASASSDTTTGVSVVEAARLQEREKSLIADIVRKDSEFRSLADALDSLQKDHAVSREKLAAADEKATGLQQTLSHERDTNDASRRASLSDLSAATEGRDRVQISFTEASQKLAAAVQMELELRDRVRRAETHIEERDKKLTDVERLLDNYRTQLATKDCDLSASVEREVAINRTVAERDQQLEGLQDKLKTEFENIANKVLATTASQLSETSQGSLAAILDPLKEKIAEFQTEVKATHLADTAQRSVLGEQIKQVAQTNQSIGLEAHNLTKALKGDSQMRGRWGEVRLERILEKSGLERGREFVIQGGDFNIKSEEGGSQRPDVIILLPEHRHFVIDSKVSLVDYLEYESAETDDSRARSLKKLLSSVRGHIDDLAGKRYQYADAINSHDLVFMFIPIEGVAALVLQNDESVFDYAWSKKIVMASPSTLFMTMQTVVSIWRYERQSENAQAIAEHAGQLYDKLVGVVGDLNDVSQKIQSAADAHANAMKKLSTGKGNALSKAEKLKTLGVSSKKDLPVILLNNEKHVVAADDDDDVSFVELDRIKLLGEPVG